MPNRSNIIFWLFIDNKLFCLRIKILLIIVHMFCFTAGQYFTRRTRARPNIGSRVGVRFFQEETSCVRVSVIWVLFYFKTFKISILAILVIPFSVYLLNIT